MGSSPCGCKESDTTEMTAHARPHTAGRKVHSVLAGHRKKLCHSKRSLRKHDSEMYCGVLDRILEQKRTLDENQLRESE